MQILICTRASGTKKSWGEPPDNARIVVEVDASEGRTQLAGSVNAEFRYHFPAPVPESVSPGRRHVHLL